MSYAPHNKLLLIVLCSLFCLTGCGQKIKDSVKAVDTTLIKADKHCAKIVMLPFADYSSGKHLDDSLKRQIKIQTSITYNLAQKGYYLPMEEDVVQYLIDLGVITLIESPSIQTKRNRQTFFRELGSGWSDEMKAEIHNVLLENDLIKAPEEKLKMNMIGLNKEIIKEIANYFGADYILRGRIVEYEIREGQELNPLQQGILPFFFDWSSATLFGVAKSEKYDLWHDLAIGGTMGAGLGSSANTPFNAPSKSSKIVGTHPRFAQVITETSGGYTNSALLNAGAWGAAGMATAYLASKGGYIPKAVVQISLALQDPETGRIVWTNRVEKEVEPITMWADSSHRKQMDTAIEEATRTLLKDLTNTLALCEKCDPNYVTGCQEVANNNITDDKQITLPKQSKSPPVEPIQELEILKKKPENWGS